MAAVGATVSGEEICTAAQRRNSAAVARRMPHWFDNVTCERDGDTYTMGYVEVRPQTVQHIDTAKFTTVGDGEGTPANTEAAFGELVWPDAPPLPDAMQEFRKPGDYNTIQAMVKLGKHISLEGPPGTGKSTAVEQLALEAGKPLVSIGASAGLRKRDMIGTQEVVNGTSKFVVAQFAAAVVNGWWAKVDEVNAADPDVIMLLNGITASPYIINIHGKMYPVHPEFRLFITYNYGLVGTKPLPSSLKDRFYPVKWTFPSASQLKRILQAHGMPTDAEIQKQFPGSAFVAAPYWTDRVVQFACALWQAHERGQMRYQISARRLIDAVDLYKAQEDGKQNIVQALKMAVIACIDNPLDAQQARNILGGL
jgi:hypothetical protein